MDWKEILDNALFYFIPMDMKLVYGMIRIILRAIFLYELFGMEANNPTFAYELDEAVRDGFLVPPVAISVPTKFHREGIKYSELSDEEKEEYEDKFADPITEELFLKEIDSNALNDWLFNTNTVDQILSHILRNGIKVEGGDKLAKTMIFARSHSHAKFIEERFNEQFKQYKGEFLRVIDYQEEQIKSLLESFKDNNRFPQIAVSVDMLDTGIDVPEVCNLVFYKPVKSLTKFWQMVGRGTRLCENLFGHGLHKKEFVEAYGEQPLGRFIRSIVGLEAKVAKELFGKILGNQTLNARQIKFMDTIINYLCVKGVIDPAMLFEPPFTDISSNGISDVFDDSTTDKIISLIEEINKKADAA